VGLRGCSIAGSDGTSPAPTVGGAADKLPVLSLTSELCLLSLPIAEEVGFSAATPAEEGSKESLWAELPPELVAKVLERLPAAEQSAPQAGGWRGCKDSAAVRLVCKAAKYHHDALVTRQLLRHEITDEAMRVLVRRFPAVVSLELKEKYGVSPLTDEALRAVSGLTALTFLDLTHCENVTDKGLRAVSSCSALTSLRVTCCKLLTDEGLRAVSSLPALTFLDLSHYYWKTTNEGMRPVSSPALTSLNLYGCCKVTGLGLRALSSLNSITSLNLGRCVRVTDEGMRAVSSMPALTSLNISYCGKVTDETLRAVIK
jgi:hypothetical protein